MPFRTVIVDTHSKLEYSLNYFVYRTPEETKRILMDEIHTVVLQSTSISITTSLLAELTKRKIKVIFCDEKRNPSSELVPYYGAHNCSKRIQEQIKWSNDIKDQVWQRIVQHKIINQALLLEKKNKEQYTQVKEYVAEVLPGDSSNREGHAAKVYFNNIFHTGFTRLDDSPINAYLNYGYTILLSQFNRAVVAYGYITQLGIHHKNEYNEFNLSCDLMEPFRIIVDWKASFITEQSNFKDEMISLLSKEVTIDGKKQTLANAITIYTNSVFNALNNINPNKIMFVDDYDI